MARVMCNLDGLIVGIERDNWILCLSGYAYSIQNLNSSSGCLLLRLIVCDSENITRSLTWNWELVGEGFRCVANQPVRLLRNCERAQHNSMKNEICNVERCGLSATT